MTAQGSEKRPVFRDDDDRQCFLDTLQRVNRRYRWICHAYCLMADHYHLLIETPDGNLAIGMRQLNGVYTQLFNRRHGRSGHLFQGRYKSILIQKNTHLLEVCRHVVLNPVRAKIAAKPEIYRWSSYAATAGKAKPHPCLSRDWVLSQFGGKRNSTEKEFRNFVSQGIGRKSVWNEVRGQVLLGEGDFVKRLTGYLKKHKDVPEIPRSQRFAHRPSLKTLFGNGPQRDRKRRRNAVIKAIEQFGYRQSEIGDYLGLHYTSISKIAKGER